MAVDTQTVTIGTNGGTRVGYATNAGSFGSISDGTSNMYSGAAYEAAYWDSSDNTFRIYIQSTSLLAGGTFAGVTFQDGLFLAENAAFRSYISYITTTQWYWAGITSSPWNGATSGTKTLTFESPTGGYGFQVFNGSGTNVLDSRTDKQTTAVVSGTVNLNTGVTSNAISCPGMTTTNTDEIAVLFYDEPNPPGYGFSATGITRGTNSFTITNNSGSNVNFKYVGIRY